jgi:hypothetical protein
MGRIQANSSGSSLANTARMSSITGRGPCITAVLLHQLGIWIPLAYLQTYLSIHDMVLVVNCLGHTGTKALYQTLSFLELVHSGMYHHKPVFMVIFDHVWK